MGSIGDTGSSAPDGKDASLPIVDISPYLNVSNSRDPQASATASKEATDAALRAALLEHGFFYVTNHGIPSDFLASVIAHARTFFTSAPATEKQCIKRQDAGVGVGDGARGYQVIGENVTVGHRDWHEAIDWYAPVRDGEGLNAAELLEEAGSPQHRQPPYPLLEGVNLWPTTPPTFRAVYEDYVRRMRALGTAILHAMGAALELNDTAVFAEAARDSCWVMRAIGYPPLDPQLAAQGGVSCGEHSDYGCLTLLLADNTPGALQVRDQTTGDWKEVTPLPGALVINVGDMVELWTAGLVRSTKHRVVHTGKNYRVSVPFFLEPGKDVLVRPLDECVEMVKKRGKAPLEGEVRYWDHLVGKVGGNFYQPAVDGG